jgi:hypothetical protein
MNWIQIAKAAITACIVASMTDWYFFGVLFHRRYRSIPGVWREYRDKKDEATSITIATLYQSITTVVFTVACAYLQLTSIGPVTISALVVWLMLPLPLLLSYGIFIRMDRLIVLSHSLGWLARLLVTALCISWFL